MKIHPEMTLQLSKKNDAFPWRQFFRTPRNFMLLPIIATFLFLLGATSAQAQLTVAVEMGPYPIQPGDTLHTALTVTNPDSATHNNVVVKATVPDWVNDFSDSYTSGGGSCPGGTCNSGELVTWDIGALAPGSAVTVSMPPMVRTYSPPSAGTVLEVDAQVFEDGAAGAVATGSVVVASIPVLSLSLDEDGDPVAPGAELTYTLTYGNRSSANVSGAMLTLPLPVETTFVSATGEGSLVGETVEWSLDSLAAGEGGRHEVVVTVDGAMSDGKLLQVTNAALTGEQNFATHTARATAVTHVKSAAPLSLSVAMNPDPVQPGATLEVTLTVSNQGSSLLSGVVLQGRVPDWVNNFSDSYTSGGGSCPGGTCNSGELVTWDIGALAPGSAVTVSMPPMVRTYSPPSAGTVLEVDAQVFEDGAAGAVATGSVVVASIPVLSLSLDEDGDPVAPGAELTYTLTYGNRSSANVSGAMLTLPLPVETTFVSATGEGSLVGETVEWSLDSLAAGEGGRHEVVVTVDGAMSDGKLLQVTNAALTGEQNFATHTARATAVTHVKSAAPLSLSVAMNPDPVQPGATLEVTLTVSNQGSSLLSGVVLQGRVPDWVNDFSDSYTSGGGSCPGGTCNSGELVTWDIGALAPGSAVTVSMPPMVRTYSPPSAGTVLEVDAQVFEDGAAGAVATGSVVVASIPVLSLSLDEDGDPVAPGAELTYTLTYGNRSSANVSGAMLTLPLPVETTFVSATGEGSLVGETVEWSLDSLAAGEGGRHEVVVTVDGAMSDGKLLQVTNAALTGEQNFATHTARATAVTHVKSAAPLSLSVAMNPDPVQPGATLEVTLTVSNQGSSLLSGVVLQGRVPDWVNNFSDSYTSGGGSCPGGTCNSGELVTWDIGALAPGSAVTVSMPPMVRTYSPPSAGTVLEVDAQVFEDGAAGAVATGSVVVASIPVLSLSLDEDGDPVAPGAELTYTLTYGNRSSANVSGAMLTLPLPVETTFVSATGEGSLVGETVEWSLDSLAAGEGGRHEVVVTVDGAMSDGKLLQVTNAALTGEQNFATHTARATAVTHVKSAAPLSLSVAMNPDPVQPGATLEVTLTVSNQGSSLLSGVVLQGRVPDWVNNFSDSYTSGGGSCPGGTCNSGELVTWDIGALAPGECRTLSFTPEVRSPNYGTLMRLTGLVNDDTGVQAHDADTVMVGELMTRVVVGDIDGDGDIDGADLAAFAQAYALGEGCGESVADINRDDTVNSWDIDNLSQFFGWLEE